MIFIFSFVFYLTVWQPSAVAELNPLLQTISLYDQIIVERVLTTNTLLLKNGEKVSLIGLAEASTPKSIEVARDDNGFIIPDEDPTTSFDIEAIRFVRDLVENKPVHLEFDAQRRNSDGVLLAYVFLSDDRMVNEEELRFGYAQLKLQVPNMKYAQRLRNAYKEARQEMRGLQGNW